LIDGYSENTVCSRRALQQGKQAAESRSRAFGAGTFHRTGQETSHCRSSVTRHACTDDAGRQPRNRDDLALRRRFHLTWCRRVAIANEKTGCFSVRESTTQKTRSRQRSFGRLTDCLNTATCCRRVRFSTAASARPMMNALTNRTMAWMMPTVCRSRRCEMGNPTGMHQDGQTVGRAVSSRSPQNP